MARPLRPLLGAGAMGRRQKAAEFDEEHLVDNLSAHVRRAGVQSAFDWMDYENVEASKAIKGQSLAGALARRCSVRAVLAVLLVVLRLRCALWPCSCGPLRWAVAARRPVWRTSS